MPKGMTLDGAFDGIAHCLEVFCGISPEKYELTKEIAEVGIGLVVGNMEKVIADPKSDEGKEALGLATDLGGYAIMVGSTNGAHLTSFSLVGIASHGKACAAMKSCYMVFFAAVVEDQLQVVGEIYLRHGYIKAGLDKVRGKDLGLAVAEGMTNLSRKVGFPTTLSEFLGFTDEHIERAMMAAKNPQLEMKLKNVRVLLDATLVEEHVRPILLAAKTGDFSLIKHELRVQTDLRCQLSAGATNRRL